MENNTKYNEVKVSIKEKLIRGDLKLIASMVGMTPEYVWVVLSTDRHNDKIIQAAVKLIANRKRKAETMLKQLG